MSVTPPGGPTAVNDTAVSYEKDGSPLIEETRVELVVSSGVDAERSAVVPPAGLLVGSGKAAGFRLKDPSVSRKHLELTPVAEGMLIRDLGSTNGTKVGGNRITEAVVGIGSVLVLGKTKLELVRTVERHPLPLSRRRRFGELIGSP